MDSMTASQQIVEKGKKGAAVHLKNCQSPESLFEFLDNYVLHYEQCIKNIESTEWIKWLMAGGKTPEEFAAQVKRYNNATTCGLVWTANFVAYRCRTCGISPCMSLCFDCFQRGHHEGHDFNMFRSQAGGACDCGDTSVMKASGFCDNHGTPEDTDKSEPPADLLYMAELMAPRIFFRLILFLRNLGQKSHSTNDIQTISDADHYLTMLNELSSMGAAMKKVLTNALISPQVYQKLTQNWAKDDSAFSHFMSRSQQLYEEALRSLGNPDPPFDFKSCPALQKELKHNTFLEELVFWTVKHEFPQKVVCFLLNMLPDIKYKEALTETFVMHYSRIAIILGKTSDPDRLSNRVVHVSVQLFSNEKLAVRMSEKFCLLQVMVVSLKNMMNGILISLPINSRSSFALEVRPKVVDCGLSIMKQHCYWPLVSDLNNVLSHRPVAVQFMSNDMLLKMWFSFLSYFQGMNVNQRELNHHVEFEPNTYYAAFSAELEASAYPMWALLSHLNNSSTVLLTRSVLHNCLIALEEWLRAVVEYDFFEENRVSFHIPLHRYLATFICQAVNVQQLPLTDILPRDDLIPLIMLHLLRIQVSYYEIVNGLWVRNGLQIKGQAMTYIQCNFCSSMVDADLYLLQILSTQLKADDFMATVIEKFHIKNWLSFFNSVERTSTNNDNDSDSPMLESFLQFLATLCSNRTNLGIEYYGLDRTYPVLTRLEMITLLCVGDKPHSQLMELMPERCGTGQSRDFDAILSQVAEYKAPNFEVNGNMQQGTYIPKSCVWEELYDPIHVLLRAVHRKDFQNSMDRFAEYVKQSRPKLLKTGTVPWPPYRIPSNCNAAYKDPRFILNTSLFHAVIWIILYKAVHVRNVSEHVLSLAVYLLEMALSIAPQSTAKSQVCTNETNNWVDVVNLDLLKWFPSDWLSANVRTIVRTIGLPVSDMRLCYENAAGLEWKPFSDSYELNSASQPSGRSMLENRSLANSNSSEVTSSSSLVSTRSNERTVALPQSSHPYGMSSDLELSRSSVTSAYPKTTVRARDKESQPSSSNASSANLSNELLPHYVQSFPMMLPMLTRKPSNQSRKSTVVSVNTDGVSSVPDMKIFNANESIISLLLKLHSHLSGEPDSFNPENVKPEELDNRIGDGPAFIGKVLTRIMLLDELCRDEIIQCRERLWPQRPFKTDKDKKDLESDEKSERKRMALGRQQKLIESFANMREEFIKKHIDATGEDKMDWEGSDQSRQQIPQREYHCVICNQSSPSTENKPMGLVVLVQATSVLGHKRRCPERAVLPISDKDRVSSFYSDILANDFEKKVEELSREFDKLSWWQSINLGWEGGIHVQTCGHHLHQECLTSYLQSLRNQARVIVDKGEYLCPLCRQLANSVLPMPPDVGENSIVTSRTEHIPTIVTDIAKLLIEIERPEAMTDYKQPQTVLMEAIKKSMSDMTECTYPKFLQRCDPNQLSTFFLFVTSIARTNLEIDIVQRGGSLLKPTVIPSSSAKENLSSLIPKRSCIMPLLHVLATHARMLPHPPVWETWQQLTGIIFKEQTSLTLNSRNVPLLLRDPAALLIQFTLLLPLNMNQMYFTCIVKLLYNLLYFQVVAQLSCHLKEAERNSYRFAKLDMSNNKLMKEFSLNYAMKLTIDSMDSVQLYLEDGSGNRNVIEEPAHETLELKIQELCLPFLRVASVLRHHIYNEPLPEVLVEPDEFVRLVYYLELVSQGMDRSKFNSSVVFTWHSEKVDFIDFWFNQFSQHVLQSQVSARNFLAELHISWKQPKLLQLPEKYDSIFQYYHQKACSHCHQVPQEGSICLVCGTLVCFKQSCCKRSKVNEAIQHSIDCGAGTVVFLVITSSCVIVVRGKRACIWGSVYLDVFGEEDRELKRGKPLFLSNERYKLLEQQWLSHRFDHISKKWILHRDGL